MGRGNQKQIGVLDCLELLKLFNVGRVEPLVVGGQAVNFWAEAFEEEEPQIGHFRPFTSADLDLYRPDAAAEQLLREHAEEVESEPDPFAKAFTIVSHTFLIQNKQGRILPVESLKMVAGLRPNDIKKGALLIEFKGVMVRILNPIACLKAKLCNLRTLDQHVRQDERHVRILLPCIRAFIRRLLIEAQTTGNYRPTINALNQFLLCTSGRNVRNLASAYHLALREALPLSELIESRHPKVQNFLDKRLPKWQQFLD